MFDMPLNPWLDLSRSRTGSYQDDSEEDSTAVPSNQGGGPSATRACIVSAAAIEALPPVAFSGPLVSANMGAFPVPSLPHVTAERAITVSMSTRQPSVPTCCVPHHFLQMLEESGDQVEEFLHSRNAGGINAATIMLTAVRLEQLSLDAAAFARKLRYVIELQLQGCTQAFQDAVLTASMQLSEGSRQPDGMVAFPSHLAPAAATDAGIAPGPPGTFAVGAFWPHQINAVGHILAPPLSFNQNMQTPMFETPAFQQGMMPQPFGLGYSGPPPSEPFYFVRPPQGPFPPFGPM